MDGVDESTRLSPKSRRVGDDICSPDGSQKLFDCVDCDLITSNGALRDKTGTGQAYNRVSMVEGFDLVG